MEPGQGAKMRDGMGSSRPWPTSVSSPQRTRLSSLHDVDEGLHGSGLDQVLVLKAVVREVAEHC